MAPLTKEDNFNFVNHDELRTNAEMSGQRFLDLARQMEAFFLQKRYLLSIQKPELILLEVRTWYHSRSSVTGMFVLMRISSVIF